MRIISPEDAADPTLSDEEQKWLDQYEFRVNEEIRRQYSVVFKTKKRVEVGLNRPPTLRVLHVLYRRCQKSGWKVYATDDFCRTDMELEPDTKNGDDNAAKSQPWWKVFPIPCCGSSEP